MWRQVLNAIPRIAAGVVSRSSSAPAATVVRDVARTGANAPFVAPSVAAFGSRRFAANLNIHKDTVDNNADTKFALTPENMKIAEGIISKYPDNYKQSAMIPLLDLAQQQNAGFCTLALMNEVARILGVAPIRVYEVASFYSMYNRQKVGKYHVMVCGTTPCMLRGSRDLEAALSEHWGIEKFQTTADGMFTLGEMECMGCCVNAPMVVVADYTNGVEGYSYNYYEDLTPKSVIEIVDKLKKGEKPKWGSQIRETCEPTPGLTSLTSPPTGPFCRDLGKVKAELEAAAKAAAAQAK